MSGITESGCVSNRVHYFVIIYLASKLTGPQTLSEDELFHNHAQLRGVLEAEQTKLDARLHRSTEQTEDIFEATAGICHRDTRASARFLRELDIRNDDADVYMKNCWLWLVEWAFSGLPGTCQPKNYASCSTSHFHRKVECFSM